MARIHRDAVFAVVGDLGLVCRRHIDLLRVSSAVCPSS